MKIHCLQHVPFEGPAKIADWAASQGHSLSYTHLYRGDKLPEVESVDWLVVMGGPMNIYEYRNHPWLRAEKNFLERAVARGKKALGVCLGAQLLADVLGAKIYQNAEKEIGWLPITVKPGAESARLLGAGQPTVFHWHGDTFDLPKGAALIAESAGCAHQAFVYDGRAVGLQFHIEVTSASIGALMENCRGDITPGRYVQSPGQILDAERYLAPAHKILWRLLDKMGD